MKLIRLLLIALLLQPCPVCWAHGFAHTEGAADCESETSDTAPACCAHCCHSQPAQDNALPPRQNKEHDCPCFCLGSELVFAQTTPAVHLRGVTVPLSVAVDPCSLSTFTAVIRNTDFDAAQSPLTVPLRI